MGKGSGGEAQVQRIRDFFMALAVCHTVIPEKFEDTDEVQDRIALQLSNSLLSHQCAKV